MKSLAYTLLVLSCALTVAQAAAEPKKDAVVYEEAAVEEVPAATDEAKK